MIELSAATVVKFLGEGGRMALKSLVVPTTNRPITLSELPAVSAQTAEDAPPVDAVIDLKEICAWLGTYRERLRVAQVEDRDRLSGDFSRWTARYQQRWAELA
jgi:hypothetical protein